MIRKTDKSTYEKVIKSKLLSMSLLKVYKILYKNPLISIRELLNIYNHNYKEVSVKTMQNRVYKLRDLKLLYSVRNEEAKKLTEDRVFWATTNNQPITKLKPSSKRKKETALEGISKIYLNIFDMQRREIREQLKEIYKEVKEI